VKPCPGARVGPTLLAALGISLIVGACGGVASTIGPAGTAAPSAAISARPTAAPIETPPDAPSPAATAIAPAAVAATGQPRPATTATPIATSAATAAPAIAATPAATAEPTVEPSTQPSVEPTASPSPAGPAGPASACSGSAENRDFFAAVAAAVSWPVYCAVLPAGWILESGSWRLKGGGQLQVAYRGPNGGRLTLQEGSYCTAGASACSPHDHELGQTAFGDKTGTLVDLGPNQPGDGYAVYVNPGVSPPSWSATATNVDQSAFVGIAANLARVAR
jgi:hypothetical protein